MDHEIQSSDWGSYEKLVLHRLDELEKQSFENKKELKEDLYQLKTTIEKVVNSQTNQALILRELRVKSGLIATITSIITTVMTTLGNHFISK